MCNHLADDVERHGSTPRCIVQCSVSMCIGIVQVPNVLLFVKHYVYQSPPLARAAAKISVASLGRQTPIKDLLTVSDTPASS